MIPQKIRPITRIIATIGELPTSYLISMTYEEQILWLCNYIETIIIPAINNNADAVAELQKALEDLRKYVDDYFDNLDLQEEIDKALDEMVESGKLEEIILEFLQIGAVLGFNTKSDLKASEKLVDGSICKTLGDLTLNDGKGHYYKVRQKTSSDVIDDENILALTISEDLVAEKILDYNKNVILNYDTIIDMISDTTLVDGSCAYVKGDLEAGDGFSGLYNITTNGTANGKYCILLQNGLYANLQNQIEENFYDEVTFESYRELETNYYLIRIPKYDKDNNEIKLYVSERDSGLNVSESARKNNTTFTMSASLAFQPYLPGDETWVDGAVIANGEIIHSQNPALVPDNMNYLGIKDDRVIKTYKGNTTTAEDMINDGVKQAFLIFWQSVENGVFIPGVNYLTKGPGQYIGQKSNGDIIILSNDGRNQDNGGFTGEEGSRILMREGCVNVWVLDGGGSTSTSVRGTKINMNVDERGRRADRYINYLLNVKKTITNKQTADIYSYIGKIKANIVSQLIGLINRKNVGIATKKIKNAGTQLLLNGNNDAILRSTSPAGTYQGVDLFNVNRNPSEYTQIESVTMKQPGYVLVNGIFQVQNNSTTTKRNVYIELMQANEVVFTMASSVEPQEFKPLTLATSFYVNTTINDPIHVRYRTNASDNEMQVTRAEISYTAFREADVPIVE